ncbi:hypothetical protein ACIPEN_00530 [Herbaspirillum chlorophenolicum]|uniref:Capsule polysaccharide biosynthesis protein n=1 Tax=Herbaspirillum chlorophenolicum TaxID=211589 RepID=A0ABW8EU05_9BURK
MTCFITPDFVIVNLPLPVAVVCHDAGAANHVAAWIKADGIVGDVRPCMQGPALRIWESHFPGSSLLATPEEVLQGARSLLSGTGWASDLEHRARLLAHQAGIVSVAVVDHWVNYRGRFVRDGVEQLPDEVWVVDEYALAVADQTLAGCDVRIKEDVYSRRLLEDVAPPEQVQGNRLLYILEPARSDWGCGEPGEFQALDYFLEHLPALKLPSDTVLQLRPHPSDPAGKYERYLSSRGGHRVELDRGGLTEALAGARWVAGCESFALVLAMKAGRQVFCSLPPWAPPCRLPHAGIIHLKNLPAL